MLLFTFCGEKFLFCEYKWIDSYKSLKQQQNFFNISCAFIRYFFFIWESLFIFIISTFYVQCHCWCKLIFYETAFYFSILNLLSIFIQFLWVNSIKLVSHSLKIFTFLLINMRALVHYMNLKFILLFLKSVLWYLIDIIIFYLLTQFQEINIHSNNYIIHYLKL